MGRKEMMKGWRAGWVALAALVILTAGERQARADAAYAWGYNLSGQVGNGTSSNNVTTPSPVSGLSSGVQSVGSGGNQSLAVTSSGQVYAWGNNFYGQLGNGTTTNTITPVLVPSLSGVQAVASGVDHSLALTSGGQVYAFGYGGDGELGNGSTSNSSSPVLVSGLSNIKSISAGQIHSLALTSGGQVYAWGSNTYGQLGNGTTTNSDTPVLVSGLSGAKAISAGADHNLALTTGGQIYAWGYGGSGQLGNGTTTNSNTPVLVSGPSGVQAVSAGGSFSLALNGSGQVYAWGGNTYGELGQGTSGGTSSTPILVSGLSNIVAIAAGFTSGYALSANGTLYTWGDNSDGQLGNGNVGGDVLSPASIATPTGYHFTSIEATSGDHTVLATLAPNAVPGPASLLSCLLGLPGVLALRRRLRRPA